MKVYAVVWSTGSCDDHGNAHSFCGVHGIYKSEESAKRGLIECKDDTVKETLDSLCYDESEKPEDHEDEIQVYGSVNESYFEVDYTLGDEPVEVYICITQTDVQE